jgi:hypothetical protein
MSMDADFGTTSRSAQARGSYSNRKRKRVPGGLGALFGAGVIYVSWHSLAKSCSAKVCLGAAVVALAASSSPPSASSISVDQNNLTSCH